MESHEEISIGTPEKANPSRSMALIAVTIALCVSVTFNALLAHKVRLVTYAKAARISEHQLSVGTIVPPLTANRLDGQKDAISYRDTTQPTVLYIFTPSCGWCARNMENLKTLLDKDGGQYRFIGLSLSADTLPEYVAKNELRLPVYSDLSPEALKTYKLGSTPQTIVISPEGKVLQDWVGAYVGDQKSQVEAFFHVNLPGLRQLPASQVAGGGVAGTP
jgi:peroxiredoxin